MDVVCLAEANGMSGGMTAALIAAIVGLAGAVGAMYKKILDDGREHAKEIAILREQETKCKVQVATLEAQMVHVQGGLNLLHATSLRTTSACFVTATLPDETITYASDEVTALLGWKPADLIGKKIDVLVPMEFRERHEVGVQRAVEAKQIRPGTIGVSAFANHVTGARVPVLVTLSEKSRTPVWEITAQINYRA